MSSNVPTDPTTQKEQDPTKQTSDGRISKTTSDGSTADTNQKPKVPPWLAQSKTVDSGESVAESSTKTGPQKTSNKYSNLPRFRESRTVRTHGDDDSNESSGDIETNTGGEITPGAHAIPGSRNIATATAINDEDIQVGSVSDYLHDPVERRSDDNLNNEIVSAVLINEEEEEARRELVVREKLRNEAIEASAVDVEMQEKQERQKRRQLIMAMICILVTVVVIVISVVLTTIPEESTFMPTTAPTPVSEEDLLLQLFAPISTAETLMNETEPSYQAMQWMLRQDEDGVVPIKSQSPQVLTDRFALATLYFATNGPTDWIDQAGFLSELTVCEWPPLNTTSREELLNRVDCNDDGRVISVKFKENNLTGTLPKEIGSIRTMVQFMIQSSSLAGTLPLELFDLTLLTTLSFNRNQLSGSILDDEVWRRLGFLRWLDLGVNRLTGTIPAAITANEVLSELRLYENDLSSTLPEFASRSALKNLLLWNCNLSGHLPLSLFSLRQLEYLDIYGNAFSGTLSTRIGNLASKLWWLELSYNDFQGALPSEIGLLTQLRFFDAHWSSFNSTLPSSIGNMDRLEDFGMIGNELTGQIPSEVGRLERTLTSVNFFGNQLSGVIPTEIGKLSSLESLVLSSNDLTGNVPSELAKISTLLIFRLANNSLTGDIDQVVCGNPRLDVGDFEADCLPLYPSAIPEITCSCCSKCCNDFGECVSTRESESMGRCLGLIDVVEEVGNITCSCYEYSNDEPPNPVGQSLAVNLRCDWQEEQCESCNEANDVCATNTVIGGMFHADSAGNFIGGSSYTEFRYTSGRNETIYFEYGSSSTSGSWCKFVVNEQLCSKCSYGLCNDNSIAHVIDCSNTLLNEQANQSVSTYNGCQADPSSLGVFDAIYVYENNLDACSLELGGLEN